jgi:hypothetical protein
MFVPVTAGYSYSLLSPLEFSISKMLKEDSLENGSSLSAGCGQEWGASAIPKQHTME